MGTYLDFFSCFDHHLLYPSLLAHDHGQGKDQNEHQGKQDVANSYTHQVSDHSINTSVTFQRSAEKGIVKPKFKQPSYCSAAFSTGTGQIH